MLKRAGAAVDKTARKTNSPQKGRTARFSRVLWTIWRGETRVPSRETGHSPGFAEEQVVSRLFREILEREPFADGKSLFR